MASRSKKRKRRNRLIISIATILIAFCIFVMIFVAIEAFKENSQKGTPFMLLEIPLVVAILMIFFIAKDRLK